MTKRVSLFLWLQGRCVRRFLFVTACLLNAPDLFQYESHGHTAGTRHGLGCPFYSRPWSFLHLVLVSEQRCIEKRDVADLSGSS
jgi:hypothetical protein